MTPVLWRTRWAVDGLGWQGGLGIALLAASAIFVATAGTSKLADLAAAQSEVETLRARHLLAGPEGGRGRASREDQLANFYSYFPPLDTLPDWLDRVYEAAEKNGVQLDVGEYRLVQQRGRRLARYQMTLPVRGSYAQVRGFIADLLTSVPAAALDEVGFRREAIGSAQLETRLRITLYLGGA